MKIVFLDFDGVLNSEKYLMYLPDSGHPKLSSNWWAHSIDPGAVTLLNGLIERTGAKVVISSTWRIGASREWLQHVLESRGFVGEIIGVTENYPGQDRRYEIQEWLDEAGIEFESFVIFDDDGDAWIDGHFVQTDFKVGLTEKDIEKAFKVLSLHPQFRL